MALFFPRRMAILSLALLLSACATSGVMPTSNDAQSVYDDKINAALSRAAGEAGRQGATEGSLLLLERVYKRNPESAEAAVEFARGLRNAGELQKAQLVLEPFANKADAKADTLTEFASLRLNQTQYAAAETMARKAVAKEANAYRAYQVLGIALDAQERYEDAETAFRKALDLWQGDPIPVMNNLALNLTNQERLPEALEIMKKAKEAAPNRPEVERNLRIIRTLNESATGRPAPKPMGKPHARPVSEQLFDEKAEKIDALPATRAAQGVGVEPLPAVADAPPPTKGMKPIIEAAKPTAGKTTLQATGTTMKKAETVGAAPVKKEAVQEALKALPDPKSAEPKKAAAIPAPTAAKLPDLAPAAGPNTTPQQ